MPYGRNNLNEFFGSARSSFSPATNRKMPSCDPAETTETLQRYDILGFSGGPGQIIFFAAERSITAFEEAQDTSEKLMISTDRISFMLFSFINLMYLFVSGCLHETHFVSLVFLLNSKNAYQNGLNRPSNTRVTRRNTR